MGATTTTHELAISQVVDLLGPGGTYEKKRLALREEYGQIVTAASNITAITTHEEAEHAVGLGRLLQVASKETEGFYKSVKQTIDAVKAPVLAAEKADLQPYESEKCRLGALQTQYLQEERRRQEEADRKAREEAARIAQEELLQRAIDLEEMGEPEAAEQALEEPMEPVFVQSAAPPKIEGSYGRVTYSATVVSLMELVKAVAAGKVPITAIEANMVFLNGRARSDKEGFSIPGVKLNKETSTSFRR